jgi:predicted metal-binding protein
MVKVGVIFCSKCDTCLEFKDLVTKDGMGVFTDLGPAKLVGCITCDKCPGKSVVDRAKLLIKCGADIIAFSSCSDNNDPDANTCPHHKYILGELSDRLKSTIVIACRNGISA